ncbi:MAG: hypothetical protein R2729_09395 [Bryobacteraceae bacterium]
MHDEILPVTGIFLDPSVAESTATTLRSKGMAVQLYPIADSNPATFPLTRLETTFQWGKALTSEPLFILGFAVAGLVVGLLLQNVLAGIVATLTFAFAGALIGLWLADRPPVRYREYVRKGAVVLSVHCTADQQPAALGALEQGHAVEVGASSTTA